MKKALISIIALGLASATPAFATGLNGSLTIKLQTAVAPACDFGGADRITKEFGIQGGATSDLGGGPEDIVIDRFTCNNDYDLSLTADNGKFIKLTPGGCSGSEYSYEVEYGAKVHVGGTEVISAIGGSALGLPATDDKTLRVEVNIESNPGPLCTGEYGDDLVLTVTPAS